MPDSSRARTSRSHLDQLALAQRWGLSPKTLERWRWARVGPVYVKIGGRVRYQLADIETYEAAQRRGGR